MAFAGSVALVRNGLSALATLYNHLRNHAARCHPWQLVLLLSLAVVCFAPLPLAGFDHVRRLRPIHINIHYSGDRHMRERSAEENGNAPLHHIQRSRSGLTGDLRAVFRRRDA